MLHSFKESDDRVGQLKRLILEHPIIEHDWFKILHEERVDPERLIKLLFNYDAHAALLRRLLLKACVLMPEGAVGFVLENVRTEYGSGDYSKAHHFQILDLIKKLGETCKVDTDDSLKEISQGVHQYMLEVPSFFSPEELEPEEGMYAPCVSAGAILATEVLAELEFKALQHAFKPFGLHEHIWFNHLTVEKEHADESFNLALYFLNEDDRCMESLEFGIGGILMCNSSLYNGFLDVVVKPEQQLAAN